MWKRGISALAVGFSLFIAVVNVRASLSKPSSRTALRSVPSFFGKELGLFVFQRLFFVWDDFKDPAFMRSVYVLCPMYLTVLYVVNYMCSFQCAMCNPFLNIAHRSDLKSLIQVEVKSRLDPIATLHGVIIKISN